MPEKIQLYISSQKIGVLAVPLNDGTLHAATVHFAKDETHPWFYIYTSKNSRKVQAIQNTSVPAAFVIGVSESDFRTLQMDGSLRYITSEEEKAFADTYFKKFPEKPEQFPREHHACLVFIPTWLRFTDWTTPQGKEITEVAF